MSFVWNVMLSFDNEEFWEDGEDECRETCEPLDRINAWLSPARLVSLTGATYEDDAGYGMDANLYGGGFKHFDSEGFIEVVKAQDWKSRSKVQLWIKGAEEGMGDEPFALTKLGGRRSETAATRKAKRVDAIGGVVSSTPPKRSNYSEGL
jgi:hypothetical protein